MSGWGGGDAADEGDPWFRPVWADNDEDGETEPAPAGLGADGDAPAWRPARGAGQGGAAPWLAGPALAALLGPLCAATDALARLDARAGAAPEAVREGLAARLALREAAGLLAHHAAWVHPLDLALREEGLTGAFDLAARAGRGRQALPGTLGDDGGSTSAWDEFDDAGLLGADAAVTTALHLARRHRRLALMPAAAADALLADPDEARAALEPLGPDRLDAARLRRWLAGLPPRDGRRAARGRGRGAGPDGPEPGDGQGPALPPLLAAARAAERWMESGIADPPTPAQAGLVAALCLARSGALRASALPLWAAYPAVGPGERDALPRLRDEGQAPGGGAARDGNIAVAATCWPRAFLGLVREGALAGLRELDRLLAVADKGREALTGRDRRSRLPDALDEALRAPALTGTALARRLNVAPQTATALLRDLAALGLVREATGRRHFRAWAA